MTMSRIKIVLPAAPHARAPPGAARRYARPAAPYSAVAPADLARAGRNRGPSRTIDLLFLQS
jgi:hypothetical protein